MLLGHAQRAALVGGAQCVGPAGGAPQLRQRALEYDAAAAEDPHPVAQGLDLGEDVRREDDRHPPVGETPDEIPHVAYPCRIESRGGLVEQEQLGVAQERRGDPQALPHAVRVAGDLVSRAVAELDGLEHGVDPPPSTATVVCGQQLEVLASRQIRIEPRLLDEARDAVEPPGTVDERLMPEQAHSTLVRPDQSEQHPQGCRLPGAVRAEISVDIAALHGQVDVVDRDDVAVALDEAARLDGRRHHRPRAAASAVDLPTGPTTT